MLYSLMTLIKIICDKTWHDSIIRHFNINNINTNYWQYNSKLKEYCKTFKIIIKKAKYLLFTQWKYINEEESITI